MGDNGRTETPLCWKIELFSKNHLSFKQVLDCACRGKFSVGDRVLSTDKSTEPGPGFKGTIVAGGAEPELLVEFDDWNFGHDGKCHDATCGACAGSPRKNRWWVECDEVELQAD